MHSPADTHRVVSIDSPPSIIYVSEPPLQQGTPQGGGTVNELFNHPVEISMRLRVEVVDVTCDLRLTAEERDIARKPLKLARSE